MFGVADYYFNRAIQVSPDFLVAQGISCLLLDIDNTLAHANNPVAAQGVREWLSQLERAGIRACILSNNSAQRIESFARSVQLPFVAKARKPLSGGIRRALSLMKSAASQTAVVGDQIFTDVLGAQLSGCRSIFVDYFEKETDAFFAAKRFFERPFVRATKRKAKNVR